MASLGPLGLLLSTPLGKYVSGLYLIPSFESSVFRCCPSVKDGLDVDGHVTVGRTETSNDGETQTLLTTSELDNCAAKDKTLLVTRHLLLRRFECSKVSLTKCYNNLMLFFSSSFILN